MQFAMALAFVVVAAAPLIGIWRGHVWAKANGFVLRNDSNLRMAGSPSDSSNQIA